jgi:hypothetical protein
LKNAECGYHCRSKRREQTDGIAPYPPRDTVGILEYVNAEPTAAGSSAFAPENSAFEAGKIMLARLDQLAGQNSTQ